MLIIAPDDTCGVKTLTRDQEALKKLYTKGIRDASHRGIYNNRSPPLFRDTDKAAGFMFF